MLQGFRLLSTETTNPDFCTKSSVGSKFIFILKNSKPTETLEERGWTSFSLFLGLYSQLSEHAGNRLVQGEGVQSNCGEWP